MKEGSPSIPDGVSKPTEVQTGQPESVPVRTGVSETSHTTPTTPPERPGQVHREPTRPRSEPFVPVAPGRTLRAERRKPTGETSDTGDSTSTAPDIDARTGDMLEVGTGSQPRIWAKLVPGTPEHAAAQAANSHNVVIDNPTKKEPDWDKDFEPYHKESDTPGDKETGEESGDKGGGKEKTIFPGDNGPATETPSQEGSEKDTDKKLPGDKEVQLPKAESGTDGENGDGGEGQGDSGTDSGSDAPSEPAPTQEPERPAEPESPAEPQKPADEEQHAEVDGQDEGDKKDSTDESAAEQEAQDEIVPNVDKQIANLNKFEQDLKKIYGDNIPPVIQNTIDEQRRRLERTTPQPEATPARPDLRVVPDISADTDDSTTDGSDQGEKSNVYDIEDGTRIEEDDASRELTDGERAAFEAEALRDEARIVEEAVQDELKARGQDASVTELPDRRSRDETDGSDSEGDDGDSKTDKSAEVVDIEPRRAKKEYGPEFGALVEEVKEDIPPVSQAERDALERALDEMRPSETGSSTATGEGESGEQSGDNGSDTTQQEGGSDNGDTQE